MKTIRKLKGSQRWKAMLIMALLFLSVNGAMAYTVTVTSNNTNYGTVTGGGNYANGATCTIKATAKTNYGFYRWLKKEGSNWVQLDPHATYSFTVTSNIQIRADFFPAWDGTQTSGAYMLTHDVTLTKTVILDGTLRLRVNRGGNHNRPVTIRRGNGFDGSFFFVQGNQDDGDYLLSITGNITSTYYDTIYFEGGAVYNTAGDARSGLRSKPGSGLCVYMGRYAMLEMDHVVMQNFYNDKTESGMHGTGHWYWRGGAIVTHNNNDAGEFMIQCPDNTTSFRVANSVVRGCYGRSCGSSFTFEWTKHKAEITNVKVQKCAVGLFGDQSEDGGTFRCYGSTNVNLTLNNCVFSNNKTRGPGGAINWYAGGGSLAKLTIKGNSKFYGNESTGAGGGLHLGGLCDIQKAEIYNNKSGGNGGGMTMFTYSGGREYEGYGVKVTVNANVSVHDNEALGFGGGIAVALNTTILDQLGFNSSDNPRTEAETECYVKIMDGGKIFNNRATRGGGIYVEDRLPYRHKNTVSGKLSPVYKRSVTIEGGEIYNNYAKNVGNPNFDSYFGGAIYMAKHPYTNNAGYLYDYQTYGAGTFTFDVKGGLIHHNVCEGKGYGGAFYLLDQFKENNQYNSTCNINVNNSSGNGTAIYSNRAYLDGGGFYARCATVTVSGGYIGKKLDGTAAGNIADRNGGGFYVNAANNTILTTIKGGVTMANNSAVNGGGAYINQGQLVIQDAATNLTGNTASTSGGGIYMAGGTVTFTNAKMQSNTATNNDGGGLYLGNGTMTVSGANAAFTANKAKNRGGGVYVGGGSFTMTGGAIGGTTAQGNYTTSGAGYGGGLYMGGGTATLSGGTLGGNKAEGGYGGAIYMNGGTCTLSNGATIGGATASYANSAKYGGGIYSAGGTITVKGGKIQRNTASTAGGGIYTNGADGVVNMEKQTSKAEMLSYIEYNTAEEGGGIYANRGVVNFSDGYIQYNRASAAGGGIYVNRSGNDYGILNLKGSANLSYNNVPEGHDGGGVYLKGRIVVGEAGASGRIMAQTNYSGDSYSYTWEDHGNPTDSIDHILTNNRNNVYLPLPEVRDDHTDVIEIIENGVSDDSHVGFSVEHGYVPVIYCRYSETSRDYLHQFSTGQAHQYNVFDDTRRYIAVQYSNQPDVFDPDHVYLYGFWSNEVTGDADLDYCVVDTAMFRLNDPIPLSNPCELAFFITWVNGLNNVEAHPNANAILMADIDMSEFGWVPIGKSDAGYGGTFDGNGHTVSGLVGLLYREYTDYGFFGKLKKGAEVKDLFVNGANFYLEENGNAMVVGGLAGEINDSVFISNSEVASHIYVENTGSVAGGLIGRQNGGMVHSAIGISDMTGYLMGGLVGELLGGSVYNSFSNVKFASPAIHTQYMGGLAAVNRGTVENCYARLRGSAPTGNFGILVGDNTGGVVNYCYAPAGMTDYKVAGANPTGHGNYGESFLPYLYGHRDTQVSLANSSNGYVPTDASADKQMMVALNNWVDANSTASVAYTTWGRPWHESNAVKPLNDDYPILRMPMAEAVGAKAGDPYLYYNPVDSLLVRYTDAESAIWLYRNPADVVRGDNSGSAAKLYIAEDVALKNLNELKAYVGITLDNSAGGQGANPTYGQLVGITSDATDWHMISSPLMDAPIGINYSDNGSYDFSWGHPDGMPYYLFFPKGNARNGYFPSHRFGENYPTSDATIEAGSYYNEWDFYSYSEPNYHWINFKRNSNSHRHFDTETHEPISYGNEPGLIPGKGYFAATREETFLQCQGNLNADEVIIGLTMTTGVPRHGYNLIGNPYQAYLDFDAFAECNSDDVDAIWDDVTTASYTILDEDAASYLTFAYDGSDNPDAAGRFIHPHQGFFVRTGLVVSMAYFLPDMRNTTARNSTFRGNDHIDYPLVNLFVSEANGNSDMVTVELGRPTQGGALLMQGLRAGNGKIWCHYNDVDYAVAYTQPGVTEAAIRFESVKDTEYTMRWTTRNGEFSYLHLIDNKTGADVDCLTTDEYKFSASTSDYKSRFRLVFGYTGIEEDTEAEANENFAFMMNDELVVTGEGVLQVFDVTGRMVTSQELHGVQTRVSLPAAANGVYVLRLTEGKQSRIQKMVISK